jgi:hypothetical protein
MGRREDYIDYDTTDRYKHQIDIWYRAYNINREKIILFSDFFTSLNDLVDNTFLGVDVLYKETDQRNHFTWCWDKTISNFEKEKISFKDRGSHFEYFWSFYYEAYYLVKMDEQTPKVSEYIKMLFDFTHRKTRSELDLLTETYKLLEKNLKK